MIQPQEALVYGSIRSCFQLATLVCRLVLNPSSLLSDFDARVFQYEDHDTFHLPMPSKYSHSVVLANYSSRGIISFPTNQQPDSITAVQLTPRSDTSKTRTRDSQNPVLSPTERPSTVASNLNARSSLNQNASSAKSQPGLLTSGRHSRLQQHDLTSGVVAAPSERIKTSEYVRTPTRDLRKENGSAAARLTSPYDPYHRHPEFIPADESPRPTIKKHQSENAIKPQKQTVAYPAQTVQKRPGPPRHTGTYPPPVSINRAPSKASPNSRVEALLSLQQFLDSSPRLGKLDPVINPRARTPDPRLPRKGLIASPNLYPGTVKPRPAVKRSATSFIDSSDEDDHVVNTPETSVRSATTAPAIPAIAGTSTEQTITPLSKERPFPAKTRIDLTKSLPAPPERDSPSVHGMQPSQVSQLKSSQTHTRQESDDADDPFGPLPVQKHSPLRTTKTKDKRRSLGLPSPSLYDAQAGATSLRTHSSTKSVESLPHQAGDVGLQPDFFGLAEGRDDDGEQPASDIHVHRRYYRAVDDDIPENESRPRITTANSWPSRRAAARTPTPEPWQSLMRETAAQRAMSQEKEESEENPELNILTDATPHSVNSPPSPMQNFGVPSIIRSPGTTPAAQQQQYHHAGVTASTKMRPPKMSRPRSFQKHKHARSQNPPLSRIIEAKSQEETPTDSTWKLPRVEPSDTGVFGAEIFMRLSSEYGTGSESEIERTRGDRVGFSASQPQLHDNFSTDFSITPADQVVGTASNRHLGSATSLPITGTDAVRPRTHSRIASRQDQGIEQEDDGVQDDDDEYELADDEHASAAPPPDITRFRRTRSDESTNTITDQDGLQSLINALRAGPSLTRPATTTAKIQGHGQTSTHRNRSFRGDDAPCGRGRAEEKWGWRCATQQN